MRYHNGIPTIQLLGFEKQLTTRTLNNAARANGAKERQIPLNTFSFTGSGCATVSPDRSSSVVTVTGPAAPERTVFQRPF